MFLLDDALVTSASDLTLASHCEFAFLRTLDLKLGRVDGVPVDDDAMLARTGALGDVHEAVVLEHYRAERTVVEIARPGSMSREGLQDVAAQSARAFEVDPVSGVAADVVFQATFFDETDPDAPFLGFADFVVRRPDGRWRVQDTKLARSVKVTALMQLAAYHEQLERLGIPVDDTVELLLGDGSVSAHHIDEILPVFRRRRRRLHEIVAAHRAETGPVLWGDDRYSVDGRCVHCDAEVQASRDLLLVAGMRVTQRAQLLAAGIRDLDALATTPSRPAGCELGESSYTALHEQAALQAVAAGGRPPFRVRDAAALAALPAPSAGDLFFDFEGDPLFSDSGSGRWGLDYLFGMVDVDERFTAFWAHDLDEERQALLDFLAFVKERRARHPDLHIYHYASYERTHLLLIAARHGVGEHDVDDLLRDGVLVDLYPIVKKALRVGSRSYSIKKLEPLYMGDEHRDGGVTNAGDSVVEYARYAEAVATGDQAGADVILADIEDYNRYDCVSTLRLRDWLRSLAADEGMTPEPPPEPIERPLFEPSALSERLLELAAAADGEARQGYELASAAIDYHRREDKSFWWEHFSRLSAPVDDWTDTRGVFAVEGGVVLEPWGRQGRQKKERRVLRLDGAWAPGSGTPRGEAFVVYELPVPYVGARAAASDRLAVSATIEPQDDGTVHVTETCPVAETPWDQLPIAVTPGPPPKTASVVAAIEEWAQSVVDHPEHWPHDPAADILRRLRPRTHAGTDSGTDDPVAAVVAKLLDLDASYLAVQGPPGTGKTYLAAKVIGELVRRHRWKVGVVAQSHKVVENVLDGIVDQGLPAELVGKKPQDAAGDHLFTPLEQDGQRAFAEANEATGYVLGGTVWDLTNTKRIDRGQLDLLVIDEAGQFSLANTIAASVSAERLLLLGDPQQLPQVSQGTHPSPVDASALGHIIGDAHVLPPDRGVFLAQSRRMHPAVTAPVSRLAYDGALHAHPTAAERRLEGVEPGLRSVPVAHAGNATASAEEASRVVAIVRDLLGAAWTPASDAAPRPLAERDVIVVTPYNAQAELVSTHLEAAGIRQVRVGTVDRFQGQEAAVAIVSLAASSAEEVPRGLSFLLSRNRLNVAISRAQWAAFLVYSPGLTDALPATPDGVAELSRFLTLVGD